MKEFLVIQRPSAEHPSTPCRVRPRCAALGLRASPDAAHAPSALSNRVGRRPPRSIYQQSETQVTWEFNWNPSSPECQYKIHASNSLLWQDIASNSRRPLLKCHGKLGTKIWSVHKWNCVGFLWSTGYLDVAFFKKSRVWFAQRGCRRVVGAQQVIYLAVMGWGAQGPKCRWIKREEACVPPACCFSYPKTAQGKRFHPSRTQKCFRWCTGPEHG